MNGRGHDRGVGSQAGRWLGPILRTWQVDGNPLDGTTVELMGEFLPAPCPAPTAVNEKVCRNAITIPVAKLRVALNSREWMDGAII
jgi:hypothetical protein